MLSVHMLDTPSGTWSAYTGVASMAEWGVHFAALRRLIVHYGLLGELAGCEILCLGSDQRNATYTKLREENRRDWETLRAKLEAWRGLIQAARSAFTGGLTYAASHGNQPAEIEFWPELDFVGCDLFDPVVAFEDPSLAIDRNRAVALMRWNLEELLETARRNQRPLLLTSFGYPATSRARFAPMAAPGEFDPAAQAWLLDAFSFALAEVRAAHPGRIAGLYAWCLPLQTGRSRMLDLFAPQGERSRESLRSIFAAP
jgi:hypothetical protein